jgi:hypothetical protein
VKPIVGALSYYRGREINVKPSMGALSYYRGRDQEDHGLRPAWAKITKSPSQPTSTKKKKEKLRKKGTIFFFFFFCGTGV